MGIYALPIVEVAGEIPRDGEVYPVPDLCRGVFNNKCKAHYESISKSSSGIYKCPYGLFTYKTTTGGVFSCFCIKGKIGKKTRRHCTSNGVQAFSPDMLEKVIGADLSKLHQMPPAMVQPKVEYIPESNQVAPPKEIESAPRQEGKQVLAVGLGENNSVLHEFRPINDEIKAIAEELQDRLEGMDKYRAGNIFHCSEMLTMRMDIIDFFRSPTSAASPQLARKVGVYKSFDKVRKILSHRCERENKPIKIDGISFADINGYKSFDLVPYLLFDNCLKYSIPGEQNLAHINVNSGIIRIKLETTGPHILDKEANTIFELNHRGENAKKTGYDGLGVGLYIVKKVLEIHGGKVRVTSTKWKKYIKNVDYARVIFDIELPIR